MKLNKAFALRIKKLLKAKKMTQPKFELKTELSHGILNEILNCKSPIINLVHIALIIKALGMSMSEFFDSELFDFNNLELEETSLNYSTLNDIMNYKCKTTNFMNLVIIIRALGMSISEFFDSELFDFNNLELEEK